LSSHMSRYTRFGFTVQECRRKAAVIRRRP
jgi:hypothetical protein